GEQSGMVLAGTGRFICESRRLGCHVGGFGGTGAPASGPLELFGGSVFGLVPPRSGWISLRCRLQSSASGLAVHHGAGAAGVSRNDFSAGRTGGSMGTHGAVADRRWHAMGLFGVVSELFRAASGDLSRPQHQTEPTRPADSLQ